MVGICSKGNQVQAEVTQVVFYTTELLKMALYLNVIF
jgi:hypothetical protein